MGQCIRRADKIVPVAKNRNYFKAKFNFESDEWTGTKTALFIRGSYSKSQVLDSKNMCDVPWEFFDTDTNACGYVSIYCGDLVTTNKEMVKILASGYRESDASVPPTPDVYQQILGEMDKKLDKSGHSPNKYLGTDNKGNVVEKEGPTDGGTGTTDYNDLENKPRINGTELSGDKTLEELGIQQKGEYALKEEIPISLPASDVYDWAKQPQKPTYTATEVGAESKGSVNTHDVSDTAHSDIRSSISGLTEKLNSLANSDDETLDQMSEIVAYIKNNKTLIDGITTGKISTSDIVNNLVTNVTTKVLSAAQGVELKRQIDEVVKSIPKKLPNPHKLTFEGAVTAEYDGSSEITVMIPDTNGKLDKNQGVENAGKALVIGPDGNVIPGKPQSESDIKTDKTLTQENQAADAKATGDKILQYAIKNTASGESPLVITDSAEEMLQDIKLLGKSEQLSTTGKNLFDLEKAKKAESYETVNVGGTEYKAIIYRVTSNTDYTLSVSGKVSGNITNLNIGNTTTRYSLVTNNITSRSINSLEGGLIYVFFSEGTVEANIEIFYKQYFDIQLETGKVRTTYEPYTGEQPSPSPEYPQEIKNIGKYNEDTGKYEVDAVLTGKNLLNSNIYTHGYISSVDTGQKVLLNTELPASFTTSMDIRTLQGRTISMSVRTKNKAGKKYVFVDETDTIISGHFDTGQNYYSLYKSLQIPQNAHKLYFSVTYDVQENTELQVEVGSNVTIFEPYRLPQTVKLTSDRPVTKWDKLVEQDGKIGWLYQSAIDTDIRPSRKDLFPYGFNVYKDYDNGLHVYAISNVNKPKGWQTSICKQFKNENFVYNNPKLNHYSDHSGLQNWYFVTDKSTLDEFVRWMEDNPLTMVYKTVTTEFIPLAEEEQKALKALETYYPTTVIAVDGGEVYGGAEVTYIADTKNYIDNKVAANVANIISQYQINISNLLSLMPMETQATMIENDTNNILESEVTQ